MSEPFNPVQAAAALKRRLTLSSVVARDVVLRRAGAEVVGLCPFHDEATPSFYVNDAKGVYFCFGCHASGDVIDYVRDRLGLSFAGALRWLGAVPATAGRPAPPPRRTRQAAVEAAMAIWARVRPIAGTAAEAYLRRRGISIGRPSIGFARVALWRDPATGRERRWVPALIAAAQNRDGRVVGIQRICLTADGQKLGRKPKLSLGQVRGAALRLGPPAPHVTICEGPEDGLTLAQQNPQASIWVSLGTGNLHTIELPDIVRSVTVAADNNEAGRRAAAVAAAAYRAQGRAVRVTAPAAPYADWNDELLGHRQTHGTRSSPASALG